MTSNFGTKFSAEDFFRDFCPTVDGEVKKERFEQELLALKEETEKRKKLEPSTLKGEKAEKKKKLEQELLTLKKRELYRQYVSLATMIPFALLMAIELKKICSDQILLVVISVGLGHTLLPFSVLSLICMLYLIYNNRKIIQKERELENIKNGREIEKKKYNCPYIDQCLAYIKVISTVLVIVGQIMDEVSPLKVAEEALFFTASILSFAIAFYNYKKENKENKERETEKLSHAEELSKNNSNIPMAGLMLAGSSVMLIRRVMLITLASSLSPALGLAAIALLIVGSGLITHSYKRELKNVKVSGKSITGASVIDIVDRGPIHICTNM
ncbi:hypothetical protein [Wolbachia endosymbiont of Brugia pahangi]|uniref:hypothetical protein n=1 Tax=Wolbachia endosymbiont of Brugia pahangi TaxID=96495 RepID=UPI001435E04F|nr:hypothetical protein [Wolbachia endosymbiont of Brugia pahangi]QIT36493.1 LPXTG cell wall anchor domain protein [Wolbachia endosymbiont of Brugia pahangi]